MRAVACPECERWVVKDSSQHSNYRSEHPRARARAPKPSLTDRAGTRRQCDCGFEFCFTCLLPCRMLVPDNAGDDEDEQDPGGAHRPVEVFEGASEKTAPNAATRATQSASSRSSCIQKATKEPMSVAGVPRFPRTQHVHSRAVNYHEHYARAEGRCKEYTSLAEARPPQSGSVTWRMIAYCSCV
jgi:hypothetical protein